MLGGFFINKSLDFSFRMYNDAKNRPDSLEYNGVYSSFVRMLMIIYGEEINQAFLDNNPDKFDEIITTKGLNEEELNNFKTAYEKFFNLDIKQQRKTIKKKNKFFNLVQKFLIDMSVLAGLDEEKQKEFHELLFTCENEDFYRKSVALVLAYDPYEIEKYYKKQVGRNEEENKD